MEDRRYVKWTATRELMRDKRHLPLLAEMMKGWVILDARLSYEWSIEYMGWHPGLPVIPEGTLIPEVQVHMEKKSDWERGEELLTWYFQDGDKVLIKGDMIREIAPEVMVAHRKYAE